METLYRDNWEYLFMHKPLREGKKVELTIKFCCLLLFAVIVLAMMRIAYIKGSIATNSTTLPNTMNVFHCTCMYALLNNRY